MRPTGSHTAEADMLPRTKEKLEVWDFKGKECNSQGDKKEYRFGKQTFAGLSERVGHREEF